MKRRVVVILSLVIAIVLCVPSVPAFASDSNILSKFITNECFLDSDYTDENFGRYTHRDSTSGESSGTLCVYSVSQSIFDRWTSDSFTRFNDFSSFTLSPFSSNVVWFSYVSSSYIRLIMFDCSALSNYDYHSFICQSSQWNFGIYVNDDIDLSSLSIPYYQYRFFKNGSGNWVFDTSGSLSCTYSDRYVYDVDVDDSTINYNAHTVEGSTKISSFLFSGSIAKDILYGNFEHFYSLYNVLFDVYDSSGNFDSRSIRWNNLMSNNFALLCCNESNDMGFDYFGSGDVMPYFNGSEVIYPDNAASENESNSNHLYLSNFDAGYCKPYHMEELYRAGGGYLYFTYDFDSWINSHSDDYQLQVITQLNVDGTAFTYNSVWPLDLQGCLVLPFNRLASSYQWSDENILFIEYEDQSLFSNYNRGYVYAINYLKYSDPNTQKGFRSMGNGRTRSFVSANGNTHRLIGDDPAEENYFSGNSNHTQFLMSVTVRMVDNVSGDVSGSFTKTFNLLNGVSTVSNNQIRDNTNPYEPTSDDLYFPVQDSGGGYGYGGGNNQLVNFQFPSDIELFIDNGFKQFLAWYETSGDTAYVSNRFWSNMGIFEDNPAIPLYRTYFGFLPEDFKSIIFGCAGIGIIGGAFCILRRRLH